MKKISTLIAGLMLSMALFAMPPRTKLTISTFIKSQLVVMIDGIRYQSNYNVLTLDNIRSGYHDVKVYQTKRIIRNPVNNLKLLYSGRIYLRSSYYTDITINRFGKAMVDEAFIRMDDDDMVEGYNGGNGGYNGNGGNSGNGGYNGNGGNNWNDNDDDHDGYGGGNNNNPPVNRIMLAQQFEQFKQTLRNESFDNARLQTAKTVINMNYFSTEQMRQVLQLFTFENQKLEIAKYAFKRTVDREVYYTLANEFTFSSNREALMTYIQQNR
ncbi:MAG: hypothetical protein RLY16_3040 [Bacteroidota bacterium]|jgi:hypothetical protein